MFTCCSQPAAVSTLGPARLIASACQDVPVFTHFYATNATATKRKAKNSKQLETQQPSATVRPLYVKAFLQQPSVTQSCGCTQAGASNLEVLHKVTGRNNWLAKHLPFGLRVTDIVRATTCQQHLAFSLAFPGLVKSTPSMESGSKHHLLLLQELYDVEEMTVPDPVSLWAFRLVSNINALQSLGELSCRTWPTAQQPSPSAAVTKGAVQASCAPGGRAGLQAPQNTCSPNSKDPTTPSETCTKDSTSGPLTTPIGTVAREIFVWGQLQSIWVRGFLDELQYDAAHNNVVVVEHKLSSMSKFAYVTMNAEAARLQLSLYHCLLAQMMQSNDFCKQTLECFWPQYGITGTEKLPRDAAKAAKRGLIRASTLQDLLVCFLQLLHNLPQLSNTMKQVSTSPTQDNSLQDSYVFELAADENYASRSILSLRQFLKGNMAPRLTRQPGACKLCEFRLKCVDHPDVIGSTIPDSKPP